MTDEEKAEALFNALLKYYGAHIEFIRFDIADHFTLIGPNGRGVYGAVSGKDRPRTFQYLIDTFKQRDYLAITPGYKWLYYDDINDLDIQLTLLGMHP